MFFLKTGICKEKCLNGGKCIQKDTCECPKGFYGLRCEFSMYLVIHLCGNYVTHFHEPLDVAIWITSFIHYYIYYIYNQYSLY